MVDSNLDKRAISSFLACPTSSGQDPAWEDTGSPYRVVLHRTTVGSGVLASLANPGRLTSLVQRAWELLHEDRLEDGCQNTPYECPLGLCSQRVDGLPDRTLVLPWLRSQGKLLVELVVSGDRFEVLAAQCESDVERVVLEAIGDRGLPASRRGPAGSSTTARRLWLLPTSSTSQRSSSSSTARRTTGTRCKRPTGGSECGSSS